MTPKVSIIVPVYNAAPYLADTIRSVLAQTWENKEIIVVDDGSADDSLRVARGFASGQVQVISQDNAGASTARNRGLAEAQGDYIQYLDADDLLSPDKIAAQVNLLQQSPDGFLSVSATTHFLDGNDPSRGIEHNGWPMVDTDDPVDWLIELCGPEEGGMVHPGAWLTPRGVSDAAGRWNERISLDDDGEYFSRVVLASKGLRRSPTGRSFYRKFPAGSGNLSARSSRQHQASALLSLDLRAEQLFARTSEERAKKAIARCYKLRCFLAYPVDPRFRRRLCAARVSWAIIQTPPANSPRREAACWPDYSAGK